MLVHDASHCQRFTFLAEPSLESMPCGRLPVTSPGRNGFPGRLAVLSYTMCGMRDTGASFLSGWPFFSFGDWLAGLAAPVYHVLVSLPSVGLSAEVSHHAWHHPGCLCPSSLDTYTTSSAVDPPEDPQKVFCGCPPIGYRLSAVDPQVPL